MPICWDYHMVLLAQKLEQPWVVYDLDSICGLPTLADYYFDCTFRELPPEWREYAPMFRLVPAEDYGAFFHSDRSHMRNSSGQWFRSPPDWPPILSQIAGRYSLRDLINPERCNPGWIGDLSQLRARLALGELLSKS